MSLVKEFSSMPNLVDSLIEQIHARWNQSPTWIFTGQQPVLPITAGGYALRGLEQVEQGKYREAIADFNRAIGLDDHHVLAYFYRGLAYSKLLDRQKAIADYSQVIALQPNLAFAYAFRGDLHLALDALSSALDDYLRAELLLKQTADAHLTNIVMNKIHWVRHKQTLAAMAKAHPTQDNPYRSTTAPSVQQNLNHAVQKPLDSTHLLSSLSTIMISNSKVEHLPS
jgi:tetratricopeptide (TPR) repeat protein